MSTTSPKHSSKKHLLSPKYASRLALTGYHLLYSLVLSLLISALVYFVWYPDHLYQALGVLGTVQMMLALNLIVAPLLTFIVYKADKKELTRDLIVILGLQIAALGYGLYITEAGRPAYIAFAVDDFEVVRSFDNDWARLNLGVEMAEAKPLGLFDQSKFVYSVLSEEEALDSDQLKQDFTAEEFEKKEYYMRVPVIFRTDSYQDIDTAANIIMNAAMPLDALIQSNDEQRVKKVLAQYPNADGWLPLRATVTDMVVLIDNNGRVVDIVDLRPYNAKRFSEIF